MPLKLFAMIVVMVAVVFAGAAHAAEDVGPSQSEQQLAQQVSRLVQQLDDARAAERDAAEAKLLELAGETAAETDRFLALLPAETDQMPLALRERLSRIRKQVEDRVAKAAVEGTNVTLAADAMPLAEVFAAMTAQTGNRFIDNRQDAAELRISIDVTDEPFWAAVDQVLDQASLGVYAYGGEDALSIVRRGPDDGPRFGRADYSGPFRIEALEVQAQRGLRQPQRQALRLQLEVAWEPRLRPIALSQPVADVSAVTDTGSQLSVGQPQAVRDVEVPVGSQAAEIFLPFELPPREAKQIATLRGKLRALVPGRQVQFRFDDLANAAGRSERIGGVQVMVDSVRRNNFIWEIHMRLALDEDNQALQSHRGWVFQNLSYLVTPDGETIDNAGLETTRQTRNEVGVAYLFDLDEGIDGLTWVYETPAAIVELPVEYELKGIALP